MTVSETPVAAAPLAMGRVALTVHDLDKVGTFYRQAVGLHLLRQDGEVAELGAGNDVLLELRRDTAARRASPREAGLFHTAFLLPSRGDLGRWIKHAMSTRAPVTGASDHIVSEAIYLSDPEGNGVEIYADRPAAGWRWHDNKVEMATEALDVQSLVTAAGNAAWRGFPEGSSVGHVHLQVGAIAPAEEFYVGTLGFDITARYPGGTFYAVDGYHHHLATNIWNSRGAPERSYPATGLAELEIRHAGKLRAAQHTGFKDGRLELHDPWGTTFTLLAA